MIYSEPHVAFILIIQLTFFLTNTSSILAITKLSLSLKFLQAFSHLMQQLDHLPLYASVYLYEVLYSTTD